MFYDIVEILCNSEILQVYCQILKIKQTRLFICHVNLMNSMSNIVTLNIGPRYYVAVRNGKGY